MTAKLRYFDQHDRRAYATKILDLIFDSAEMGATYQMMICFYDTVNTERVFAYQSRALAVLDWYECRY